MKLSVRLRLTLVFCAVTALVTLGGCLLFATELRSGLLGSIDANLGVQLTQAMQAVPGPDHAGGLQDPGGKAVGTIRPSAPGVPSEYLMQVLHDGRVIESNQAAGTGVALVPAATLTRAHLGARYVTTHRPGGREPLRLLVAPVRGQHGWVVIVGSSLRTFVDTIRNVDEALVVAGLAIVALAALAAFWLAGAALAPVEALRRQVDRLLHEHPSELEPVSVPETGDELAALAHTLNELLERLSLSVSQLSLSLDRERALVADAGHELRTPLAVIRGELELAARRGRTPAQLRAAIAVALDETDHVSHLADDLLLLAQLDQSELPVEPEPVAVRELIERSVASAARTAEEVGVGIEIAAPESLVALLDPHRVRQVLDNLLHNALRHAPQHSLITVAATTSDTSLRLEVADRGPGFPEAFRGHAFERFARADTARARSTGGAGLGLAIVAAVAAAHGGRAEALERPGGGACVAVLLPDVVCLPDDRTRASSGPASEAPPRK